MLPIQRSALTLWPHSFPTPLVPLTSLPMRSSDQCPVSRTIATNYYPPPPVPTAFHPLLLIVALSLSLSLSLHFICILDVPHYFLICLHPDEGRDETGWTIQPYQPLPCIIGVGHVMPTNYHQANVLFIMTRHHLQYVSYPDRWKSKGHHRRPIGFWIKYIMWRTQKWDWNIICNMKRKESDKDKKLSSYRSDVILCSCVSVWFISSWLAIGGPEELFHLLVLPIHRKKRERKRVGGQRVCDTCHLIALGSVTTSNPEREREREKKINQRPMRISFDDKGANWQTKWGAAPLHRPMSIKMRERIHPLLVHPLLLLT